MTTKRLTHADLLEGQICPQCRGDYAHLTPPEYERFCKAKMCDGCKIAKREQRAMKRRSKARAKQRAILVQNVLNYTKERKQHG
jgi:hypothetical protein